MTDAETPPGKRRIPIAGKVLIWVFGGVICFLVGGIYHGWYDTKELELRRNDMGNVSTLVYTIVSYAEDHDGYLPPDLATLVEENEIAPGKVFISPGSSTPVPDSAEDIRNGQCDYYYFGKGMKLNQSSGLGMPIIATKPGIRPGEYTSVGYYAGDEVHIQSLLIVPRIVKELIEQNEVGGEKKGRENSGSD